MDSPLDKIQDIEKDFIKAEGRWRLKFSSKWLLHSYVVLVFFHFLDSLTTKIGLDMGAMEANQHMAAILYSYGFLAMVAYKFLLVAAVGLGVYLCYRLVQEKYPTQVKRSAKILTAALIIAAAQTSFVVLNNLQQIELAAADFVRYVGLFG